MVSLREALDDLAFSQRVQTRSRDERGTALGLSRSTQRCGWSAPYTHAGRRSVPKEEPDKLNVGPKRFTQINRLALGIPEPKPANEGVRMRVSWGRVREVGEGAELERRATWRG